MCVPHPMRPATTTAVIGGPEAKTTRGTCGILARPGHTNHHNDGKCHGGHRMVRGVAFLQVATPRPLRRHGLHRLLVRLLDIRTHVGTPVACVLA